MTKRAPRSQKMAMMADYAMAIIFIFRPYILQNFDALELCNKNNF